MLRKFIEKLSTAIQQYSENELRRRDLDDLRAVRGDYIRQAQQSLLDGDGSQDLVFRCIDETDRQIKNLQQ